MRFKKFILEAEHNRINNRVKLGKKYKELLDTETLPFALNVLVMLYHRQTELEKAFNATIVKNDKGFNVEDAIAFTKPVEEYLRTGKIEPSVLDNARKEMYKYREQIYHVLANMNVIRCVNSQEKPILFGTATRCRYKIDLGLLYNKCNKIIEDEDDVISDNFKVIKFKKYLNENNNNLIYATKQEAEDAVFDIIIKELSELPIMSEDEFITFVINILGENYADEEVTSYISNLYYDGYTIEQAAEEIRQEF